MHPPELLSEDADMYDRPFRDRRADWSISAGVLRHSRPVAYLQRPQPPTTPPPRSAVIRRMSCNRGARS